MRIVLVTQEEPFYLPPALEQLCKAKQGEITGLIILPSFNEKMLATARRLYEFYGFVDFMRLSQRFLWAKMADRFDALLNPKRPYSAVKVAQRYGLTVYQPANINATDFVTRLRDEVRPDLLVSIAASQILKRRVLAVPPLGCINLHSAPLPRYQGMMPNFWTLYHGEPEATVTVHYMVERLDAGDIILQKSVPILPSDSLQDLMIRSKQVGVQAVLEAIDRIASDAVQARPMDPAQATYFSFPTRKDALRLRSLGRALL